MLFDSCMQLIDMYALLNDNRYVCHREDRLRLYLLIFIPVFIFYLRMRWARHAGRMGERRGVYRVFLVGKPERKRPLGRARRRWEDNIKMAPQEV